MKNKQKILEYKKELVDVFSKLSRDKKFVAEFLVDILTPAEFETIALRWQIGMDSSVRSVSGLSFMTCELKSALCALSGNSKLPIKRWMFGSK